jgi:hypothetical protein
MDVHAERVVEAFRRREWDALRPLLQPYLHWTDSSGATIRGRSKVMPRLAEQPRVPETRWYELRDGQVYRGEEKRAAFGAFACRSKGIRFTDPEAAARV